MGAPEIQYTPIEAKIAFKYVTDGRVRHILAAMADEAPWTSKRIPELLERVWHEVVTEETWNILKDHKNPIINFRSLHQQVIRQAKTVVPELF